MHGGEIDFFRDIVADLYQFDFVIGFDTAASGSDNCPAFAVSISGTIVTAGCRSVKSDHEIELIQIGNDITKEVYLSAVQQLKEGMTEREYAAIITKLYADSVLAAVHSCYSVKHRQVRTACKNNTH